MKSNIKGLGWFIRFADVNSDVGTFYVDVLGFPFVRRGDKQKVDFYWAGEAIIFEVIFDATANDPQPDPETAECLQIYRVHGLSDILARYRAAGVPIVAGRDGALGREAFLVDPNGQLVGLRERAAAADLPQDREAARRWRRGEAFNPGCKSMPAGFQELGWIVRRVSDVAAMAAFYRDVVGLEVIGEENGRTLLDLGDNVTLELAAGGKINPPLTDRRSRPNVFILRLHQLAPMIAKLRAHGVRFANELIQWDRGALSYFLDPEGNLVGLEEKYHPSRYAPAQPPFPEDLEAERRWRELEGPVRF
jgi:catechol 2,3-dioxygenase-like lactoylglutathione lyase family enzyme